MRSLSCILVLAALSTPAAAQKVCMEQNLGFAMPGSLVTRAPAWVVGKAAAIQQMTNISAIDLQLFGSVPGLAITVGIFDVDPTTGEPGAQLASGTAMLNPETRTYTGVLSPQTASLASGAEFYIGAEIGVLPQGTAKISWDATGTGTPGAIYAGSPGAWGFVANGSIGFRVYCGSHTGSSTSFGQGKVGTNGVAPSLSAHSFPNLGNPVSYQIVDAAPGQPALVSVGLPNTMVSPPLGTLYTSPVFGTLSGMTTSTGCMSVGLTIPNNTSLTGGVLAWQGWVADPAAVAGISHTDAVRIIIGN